MSRVRSPRRKSLRGRRDPRMLDVKSRVPLWPTLLRSLLSCVVDRAVSVCVRRPPSPFLLLCCSRCVAYSSTLPRRPGRTWMRQTGTAARPSRCARTSRPCCCWRKPSRTRTAHSPSPSRRRTRPRWRRERRAKAQSLGRKRRLPLQRRLLLLPAAPKGTPATATGTGTENLPAACRRLRRRRRPLLRPRRRRLRPLPPPPRPRQAPGRTRAATRRRSRRPPRM